MVPKFKIGDIVKIDDDFEDNPESKTILIGRIEAIRIKQKSCFFGTAEGIYYDITGYSLKSIHQNYVKRYTEGG